MDGTVPRMRSPDRTVVNATTQRINRTQTIRRTIKGLAAPPITPRVRRVIPRAIRTRAVLSVMAPAEAAAATGSTDSGAGLVRLPASKCCRKSQRGQVGTLPWPYLRASLRRGTKKSALVGLQEIHEFLARFLMSTEAAEHRRRRNVGVRLLDPAHPHA